MEVLQDGVLAFLAATGLAAPVLAADGVAAAAGAARVMLLIPARPGCDFAAPAAQMLDLRRQLRGAVPIVLCDCGLEGADLRRARELTERYDDLLLLTAAEIPDHLP